MTLARNVRRICVLLTAAVVMSGCAGESPPDTAAEPEESAEPTESAEPEPTQSAAEDDSASDSGAAVEVTDAAGQTLSFDAPPRIGCIWAGCDAMLADLGMVAHASSFVAALGTDSRYYFPEGSPEQVVEDFSDVEQWVAADVEVIVTRVPDDPDNDALRAAAPVMLMHHPSYGESGLSGVDAYKANLELFAELVGDPAAAEAPLQRFEDTVELLREAAPDDASSIVVSAVFGSDDSTLLSIGNDNPFCDVLESEQLGVCTDVGSGFPELNAEAYLELDPTWIAYMGGDASHTERDDATWNRLTAVQEGQVYDAEGRIYCCSLRGLVHALLEYGHNVYGPEGGVPDPGPLSDFDPATSSALAAG